MFVKMFFPPAQRNRATRDGVGEVRHSLDGVGEGQPGDGGIRHRHARPRQEVHRLRADHRQNVSAYDEDFNSGAFSR